MKRMKDTSFFVLLTIIMLMTGCASTYKELIPQQPVSSPHGTPHFTGTVDVHSIIKPERMGFDIGYDLPIQAYVDNAMLKSALKESVANSGLFTKVVQENADYVIYKGRERSRSFPNVYSIYPDTNPAALIKATKITGIKEKTALVKLGLEALIARESARRLAKLGGTQKQLQAIPRRKGA